MPVTFAADEVIPESPVRMFAAKDPEKKVTAIKAWFEVMKLAKLDDPRLLATLHSHGAIFETVR